MIEQMGGLVLRAALANVATLLCAGVLPGFAVLSPDRLLRPGLPSARRRNRRIRKIMSESA